MLGFFVVIIPPIFLTYGLEKFTKSKFSDKKWILVYVANIIVSYIASILLFKLFLKSSDYPTISYFDITMGEVLKYLSIVIPVIIILFVVEVWLQKNSTLTKEDDSVRKNVLYHVVSVLDVFIITLAVVLLWAAKWYLDEFGDVGFDAILFTLFANQTGVDMDIIYSYLKLGLVPAIITSVVIWIPVLYRSKFKYVLTVKNEKKFRIYPFSKRTSLLVSLLICIVLVFNAAGLVGLDKYISNMLHSTTLYEDYYVAPDSVNIEFPEVKRNLIIIYLESMETSFFSVEEGGALEHNAIPELYELAENNINFSDTDGVGGGYAMTGATWTIGALTAHTSGIPLKIPLGVDQNEYLSEDFLPGVTNLSNILSEEGYYQALMVGSDAEFGGRKQYYTLHNTDMIYDLYTSYTDGIAPQDYHNGWWGVEDELLFEYAKQELLAIADMGKPFCFSFLTVDTHSKGGYVCELCDDEFSEQYENVYACSSRQVYEFVQWIMEQDFYENTTIVICGDHPTMDEEYSARCIPEDYSRRTYNCIINSPIESEYTKNRQFNTMDMFPTILASIGCDIEGDRLGLGTNLYSGVPTLLEEMGYEALDSELSRTSKYYTEEFLYE